MNCTIFTSILTIRQNTFFCTSFIIIKIFLFLLLLFSKLILYGRDPPPSLEKQSQTSHYVSAPCSGDHCCRTTFTLNHPPPPPSTQSNGFTTGAPRTPLSSTASKQKLTRQRTRPTVPSALRAERFASHLTPPRGHVHRQ